MKKQLQTSFGAFLALAASTQMAQANSVSDSQSQEAPRALWASIRQQ